MKTSSKKTHKKAFIFIFLLTFTVLFIIACGLSVKDYTDQCPHIYPRESVTAEKGSTLMLEELAEVKVLKGDHPFQAWIEPELSTQIPDAEVSADGKMLYVGTSAGTITATINARGMDDAEPKQVEIKIQ